MRLLHTGDWHLGKLLGPFSRLSEQAQFIDELVEIVKERAIDLVLVAGDVFDTHNPPAEAERLFYRALRALTGARGNGNIPVVVIAGNHDNYARLSASAPVSVLCGAMILDGIHITEPGDYHGFTVARSGDNFVEICLSDERAVIAAVPYPGEKRLNTVFTGTDDAGIRHEYSDKVGQLMADAASHFTPETVNLLTGHFYITGGSFSPDSERPLLVGGAYAVDSEKLPQDAQYIAMGHLHRAQAVSGHACAYYAGSPIQYAVSETGYAKCVIQVEVAPGQAPQTEKIYLRNYKPIEEWTAFSIEEAVDMAEACADAHCWAYLTVHTDRPFTQSELKRIRTAKRDLVEIRPVMTAVDAVCASSEAERERSPVETFAAFYQERRNAPPSDALMAMFTHMLSEH